MTRKKQLSDDALLEAMMPTLCSKGPHDFTLAEVGAAIGMAPATLVQRFGSKQGLVVAALKLANRQNFAALDKLPGEQGVEAIIQIFLDRTAGPELEHLVCDQLLWLRENMVDPEVKAVSREYFVRFRRAIAERMPKLPIPPEEAVLLLESVWHGSIIQWSAAGDRHLRDHVERNLRSWFNLINGK